MMLAAEMVKSEATPEDLLEVLRDTVKVTAQQYGPDVARKGLEDTIRDMTFVLQEMTPRPDVGKHRRFTLERDEDVSGTSGTGTVVEGVMFSDGSVAVRWLSEWASTVVWSSVEDAMQVHGHGGATRLVWVDDVSD